MALKRFLTIAFVAAVLVACGDDSSSATDSDEVSSSSVCEDCDGSSSSKAKSSSSFSVNASSAKQSSDSKSSSSAKSSSSEKNAASSSSTKSSSESSRSKNVEPDEQSSSSSSVDSSSSGTGESSSSSGGLSSSSSTESSSSVASSSSSAESSSSSVASCSSGVQSSSSVAYVDPSTVVKGSMTDERDGQTYKTVKIGTQTWMAENLNYAYTGVPYKYTYIDSSYTSDSTSWCYDNVPANCTKYGRLYTWAAAMDSVGTWSTNGKGCGYGKTCTPTYPVRGVCPEGWHLPTKAEFETLFTAVGGSSTAGRMLKSTSGWNDSKGVDGNGTDAYAFSALPASYRDYYGNFSLEGYNAYFWSSTKRNSNYAYIMLLFYYDDYAYLDNYSKGNGFSVRCVKD